MFTRLSIKNGLAESVGFRLYFLSAHLCAATGFACCSLLALSSLIGPGGPKSFSKISVQEPTWHRNLRRCRQRARARLNRPQRSNTTDIDLAAERRLSRHHGSLPPLIMGGRGQQLTNGNGNGNDWTPIVPGNVKRQAKDLVSLGFGSITYSQAVSRIMHRHSDGKGGGGGKGQPAGGAPNGKAKGNGKGNNDGNNKDKGKRGNGAYVICRSEGCRGFAYLSNMARDEVTCRKCHGLYGREWLSEDQQTHWDGLAADRGETAKVDDDFDDLDDFTAMDEDGGFPEEGKEQGEDGLEEDEEHKSLKDLQADLVEAEKVYKESGEKFEKVLTVDVWGNMQNQLLGRVNRLKERIEHARVKEPTHTDDRMAQLHKDLKVQMDKAKAEQTRIEKWQKKQEDLEKELSDAKSHEKVCKQNKEEAQRKGQQISKEMSQITSDDPPAAAKIEEESIEEEQKQQQQKEVQEAVEAALAQQRERLVAEFQTYYASNPPQPPQETKGGENFTEASSSQQPSVADLISKMGDNCKKASMGIASKSAAAVVKSNAFAKKPPITKGAAKEAAKARKLDGEAAAIVAEGKALSEHLTEDIKALS